MSFVNVVIMLFGMEFWYWFIFGVFEIGFYNCYFVCDIGLIFVFVGVCFVGGFYYCILCVFFLVVGSFWFVFYVIFYFVEVVIGCFLFISLIVDILVIFLFVVLSVIIIFNFYLE